MDTNQLNIPILDYDLNYGTLLPLNINNNNNIPLLNQRSQSASDSINPSSLLDRFYQLISEVCTKKK